MIRTVERVADGAIYTSTSGASSPSNISSHTDDKIVEEATKLSENKSKIIKGPDDETWRETIHKQMEEELSQRVREALETPPLERIERQQNNRGNNNDLKELNSHILFDLTDNDEYLRSRKWRALQAKRQMRKIMSMDYISHPPSSRIEFMFKDELSRSNQDEFPGVFGLSTSSENVRETKENNFHVERLPPVRAFQQQFYTKNGFLAALNDGKFPDGSPISKDGNGSYTDQYGVVRNEDGPFWPAECTPLFACPHFQWWLEAPHEPLQFFVKNQQPTKTVDNQETPFNGKWRGVVIVFDSDRTSRDFIPQHVPDGCCSSLQFESRFESGNLRQARRVGQFEYELVLKTDLYTNRHTQWYYFRVQNVIPGIIYKLRIINLLKKDSLYNYGMRPLVYSEKDAKMKGIGWLRTGHHIYYSRNVMHMHCPLLMRGIAYYELEWQMEFGNENDTYYLAHCYPYTFTDLKEDLDVIFTDPDRSQYITREVLCETKAGNSCFLLTVTDFENCQNEVEKKAVIFTARVHPGESQASWMMKGLLDFITGIDPIAKELRNRFIFKIIPMLNPDGVIIGNYRCSLAARDLNRNYRRPRKENFPTVYHTKQMVEDVLQKHDILLYCDLHGHSRKHNVFMYGNITSTDEEISGIGAARSFLNDRLFPWLMSQKAPDKFSFSSCKFAIKRCKESTGRVVMWRQNRISNSFTLEATFSGTVIEDECRHFNIKDYISMGESLCRTVLEYQLVQENKARQTEIVLELTRYVTHQILRQKGLLPVKMPNFRALVRAERASHMPAEPTGDSSQEETEQEQMDSDHLTEAIVSYINHGANPPKEHKQKKHSNEAKLPRSKSEVDRILDSASLETMDGCLEILAQLDVQDAVAESDSSDSDSESEPEMKQPDKSKKKKKKSKKQRDQDKQDRKPNSGEADKRKEIAKPVSALPTIACAEACQDAGQPSIQTHKKHQPSTSLEKILRARQAPHFVSKYEGRRNGGIPCFSEERSLERAAKRMAEMRRRTEDEKQRDMAFFSYQHMRKFLEQSKSHSLKPRCQEDGEEEFCVFPHSVITVQQEVPQACSSTPDIPHRLEASYCEAQPGIADTLGMKPRSAVVQSSENIPGVKTVTGGGFKSKATMLNSYSFRDISAPAALSGTMPQRDMRTGPMLRSLSRHMSTGGIHSFMTSNLFPISTSEPLAAEYSRVMHRTKIHRNPGPLIRGVKLPGHEDD